MSRMSIDMKDRFIIINSDSVDIKKHTDFESYYLIWYWYNPEAIENACNLI